MSLRYERLYYCPVMFADRHIYVYSFFGADVGGGSVANGVPHTLARIPLRWMIRECFKTNTGIMFKADDLRRIGLDSTTLYPIVQERPPALPIGDAHIEHIPKGRALPLFASPGTATSSSSSYKTEEENEVLDAMAPIYDQLSLAPLWWILEVFPVKQHVQQENNSWDRRYWSNMGAGRRVPKQKKGTVRIHRSVKMRMEAQYPDGKKYEPKACIKDALALGHVIWVD